MKLSKIKVHVRVTPTELELANGLRSGVSGRLYVEVEETFFPAQDWGDYVVPVLAWWLESASRLTLAEIDVKNIFMDGAYSFVLRRTQGADDVRISFWDAKRPMLEERTISYRRYLAALRGAAKVAIAELYALGYSGTGEAAELETRLEHLLRLEADLKTRGLS